MVVAMGKMSLKEELPQINLHESTVLASCDMKFNLCVDVVYIAYLCKHK